MMSMCCWDKMRWIEKLSWWELSWEKTECMKNQSERDRKMRNLTWTHRSTIYKRERIKLFLFSSLKWNIVFKRRYPLCYHRAVKTFFFLFLQFFSWKNLSHVIEKSVASNMFDGRLDSIRCVTHFINHDIPDIIHHKNQYNQSITINFKRWNFFFLFIQSYRLQFALENDPFCSRVKIEIKILK